jgi:hypothetical protein
MVPPPWQLVSPAGVVHVVRDEAALTALGKLNPDVIVNRENVLRKLVDPKNRKAAAPVPLHQTHWQRLERVVWLRRVGTEDLLPIVGGDGEFYVKHFVGPQHREDTRLFDGKRLQHFVKHGWVWSTTQSYEFGQKGTNVRWRRCDIGFIPDDIESHGLLYMQSGPFSNVCFCTRSNAAAPFPSDARPCF